MTVIRGKRNGSNIQVGIFVDEIVADYLRPVTNVYANGSLQRSEGRGLTVSETQTLNAAVSKKSNQTLTQLRAIAI